MPRTSSSSSMEAGGRSGSDGDADMEDVGDFYATAAPDFAASDAAHEISYGTTIGTSQPGGAASGAGGLDTNQGDGWGYQVCLLIV